MPLKHASLVNLEQAPERGRDPRDARSRRRRPWPWSRSAAASGCTGSRSSTSAPTDPLPGPAVLDHVGLMARALGAWFVVRRGQTLEASAQAARSALPEIERVVRLVGELLRAASREPQRARTHLEKAARTLDSIALLTSGLADTERPSAKR